MPPCRTKREPSEARFGNAGDVEKDILRQHIGEPGKDLLRPPALALEVHDVGLHEDRAAISEGGHGLGGEGDIGEFLHLHAEAFGSRLQEVSVAGRALRVQLEVLNAAVFEDDELDVLAADIDDDVRIVVELQRGLSMRDRFHQRHVCVQHIFEDVFGVAGRSHAENLERRALALDLLAQLLEHLDRVLDRIAIRKLIGLAKNFAVLCPAGPPWWKWNLHRCRQSRRPSGRDRNSAGMNFFLLVFLT